jgi:ankyrin repeat protein
VAVQGSVVKQPSELIEAIWSDQKDKVAQLLDSGAAADAVWKGRSALLWAITLKQSDIARMLIDQGAKVNRRNGKRLTPLMAASAQGMPEIAQLLITCGARIEAVDEDGMTALHFAARNAAPEMLEVLVSQGADLAVRDTDGGDALTWALAGRRTGNLRILVDRGIPLDRWYFAPYSPFAPEESGFSPLMIAAIGRQRDSVQILLAAGCDPGLRRPDGARAADLVRDDPELGALLDAAE